MNFEKRTTKGAKTKSILLTASVFLLLAVLIGGTLALLIDTTNDVTNTFDLVEIPNEVIETFDGETKSNVSIKNSNTQGEPAYIRAVIVVTWAEVDANGSATGTVYSTVPVPGVDYTMTMGTSANWVKGVDGYWYYKMPVASGQNTDTLIVSCVTIVDGETGVSPNQPEGYVLSVEIAAQSIQADGTNANAEKPVLLAWGETVGGCVSQVDATTGTLTIKTSTTA